MIRVDIDDVNSFRLMLNANGNEYIDVILDSRVALFVNNTREMFASCKLSCVSTDESESFSVFVIANIGCFFLMKFLFGTFLGLGIGWAILAQLILFTAIGILIFRYIIFKEDEKIQEYNDEQTDSFARYLYVRKDNVTQLSCEGQAITAFEFTNGCLTTTMLFRFGSNNDAISLAVALL